MSFYRRETFSEMTKWGLFKYISAHVILGIILGLIVLGIVATGYLVVQDPLFLMILGIFALGAWAVYEVFYT